MANLDVKWREVYSFQTNPRGPDVLLDAVLNRDLQGWSVDQDGLFFANLQGTLQGAKEPDKTQPQHLRLGYDGERTRVLEIRKKYIGNIIAGPEHNPQSFHPHTIPLRHAGARVPLSTFLSGHSAIASDPRGAGLLIKGHRLITSFEGEEVIEGQHCVKVHVHYQVVKDGSTETYCRREFWLATDRNYLPLRAVAYNFQYFPDLPIEECTLGDLREVAAGVWFPHLAKMTVYDERELREAKRSVVMWVKDYVVESVSLSPQYDVSFFRDIQFPDGTPVYEIEDRKIVRSWIEGEEPLPSVPPEQLQQRKTNWILYANIALALMILGIWIWLRLRQRA